MKHYTYTIRSTRYGSDTANRVDTYATEKYGYDDYLRAFIKEFQGMVPGFDFGDALISLINTGKAKFQSDEYQTEWEVELCKTDLT